MKRSKTYRYTRAETGRRVLAHRWLAEQALGRPLLPGEVVHHRDGDSLNNELTNLIVLPHQRFHAHAEFHSRRQKTGMPSLFPEYFQGIPESRGGLFDHVFVLVLREPPGPVRLRRISRELPELEADPLFPELLCADSPRHFALAVPPSTERGSRTLGEVLGKLAVEVKQGDTAEQAALSDFFPPQTG